MNKQETITPNHVHMRLGVAKYSSPIKTIAKVIIASSLSKTNCTSGGHSREKFEKKGKAGRGGGY